MACNQNGLDPTAAQQDGKIRFVAGGPAVTATVSTKATAVTASDLNTNGFKVNAVAGSAGADTEVWSNQLFEKVEDAWEQDKWWPNSDGSYRFYATYPTSYAMTFAAGGPTISASNEHDIICAYAASPTYKSVNTLAFDHIFARLSTVTVSMVAPYTISNMSIMITPKVSGTYNLYTGAGQTDGTGWSSTVEGSATNIATAAFSAGVSTTNNDIYLVPGTYTLSATWTATKDNYTQTFTNKTVDVDLVAGKTNNITASLTGDGTEIKFDVSVTAWSDNAVNAGTFPVAEAQVYPQPIGQFTINASGDKVGFAPGNLQCTIASGPTDTYNYTGTDWGFAEHQWDYLGNANGANSFTIGKRIDLFSYVGVAASYDTYGLCSYYEDMTDAAIPYYGNYQESGLKTDWGTIPGLVSNCGSGWRTLTDSEMDYLFNERSAGTIGEVENVRYCAASIRTDATRIGGIILFPDDYDGSTPAGVTWCESYCFNCGTTAGYYYEGNTNCTAAGWDALAAKGCVFLPCAGQYTSYGAGPDDWTFNEYCTYYWTSDLTCVMLKADDADAYYGSSGSKYERSCVRLVKDIE